MALTGIDPFDPTPATRRELIFGAGLSSTGPDRQVILYGNKQATGSEPLDTLSDTPISDDSDAIARFGDRSELYNMYRKYVAIDSGATIFGIAVTESAGTAAECTLTFVNTATASSTLEVFITGIKVSVPVSSGDTISQIASATADAINNGDDGKLMVTAVAALGVVTITHVHPGPRGDFVIGDVPATFGIRASFTKDATTTVTKGGLVAGATDDDASAAIQSAMNSEIYYHVVPWSTTNAGAGTIGPAYAISDTDNHMGELLFNILQQNLPINGKEQTLTMGHTGLVADAVSVGVSLNSVFGFCFHSEGNDLTPGMIAAHNAAVVRSQQIAQPGANFAGYTQTDNTLYSIPAPFTIGNRPTSTEIRLLLNNGVSPIAFRPNGTPYLVRFITSSNVNATGAKDYRARPGHVTSVVSFAWGQVKQRWEQTKQPFVSEDPAEGQKPTARTTTPLRINALIKSVIDDLTSSKPLGVYDGPILAPDKIEQMKNSVVVSKFTAGISAQVDFVAVEHLYKGEFTIRETGEAY